MAVGFYFHCHIGATVQRSELICQPRRLDISCYFGSEMAAGLSIGILTKSLCFNIPYDGHTKPSLSSRDRAICFNQRCFMPTFGSTSDHVFGIKNGNSNSGKDESIFSKKILPLDMQ